MQLWLIIELYGTHTRLFFSACIALCPGYAFILVVLLLLFHHLLGFWRLLSLDISGYSFFLKDLFSLKELYGCLYGACCLYNGRSVNLMGEDVNVMVKDHCEFATRYFCSATWGQKLTHVTEAGKMWWRLLTPALRHSVLKHFSKISGTCSSRCLSVHIQKSIWSIFPKTRDLNWVPLHMR